MNDDDLLDRLAGLWREHDPVPPHLADRLTRDARAEVDLLATDWDYELLALVERSTGLAGVRTADTTLTLQFATDEVDLLLRVADLGPGAGARIDGWVVPALPSRVRLTRPDGGRVATTEAGEDGRFELDLVPRGAVRLHLEPLDGGRPAVATPIFEI
jgi:hypothetical protein